MMGLLNPIYSSHDLHEMGCNTRIAGGASGTHPSLVFLHIKCCTCTSKDPLCSKEVGHGKHALLAGSWLTAVAYCA